MTNKFTDNAPQYTHPYTYEASDENNEDYLLETQCEDCDDLFGDNDF